MFFTFLLVLLCIPVTRLSDVIITLVTSMLLYTVVFTVYLVVITVRDARRIASKDLTEEEKNKIIFNPVSVTSCCGCEVTDVFCDCEENENGEEETPGTDLVGDTELWHQVWRKRKGVQK